MSLHRDSDVVFRPFPLDRVSQFRRGVSLDNPRASSKQDSSELLDDQTLMSTTRAFKKESEWLQKENLLFSLYLQRVHRTNMLQTFEEYREQDDLSEMERSRAPSMENVVQGILPMIARSRLSIRASLNLSRGDSFWAQVASNRNDILQMSLLLQIEQEKLSIAAYEIEQTHLDWNRMKNNAILELDRLEVLLRSLESDQTFEELLNQDLKKTIDQLQVPMTLTTLNRPRVMLPGDLVIRRIKKKIMGGTASLGLLHAENTAILTRMHRIDLTIRVLEQQRELMDQIDTRFVQTKYLDLNERYSNLSRELSFAKAAQQPLVRQCRAHRDFLSREEKEKGVIEKKVRMLNHFLEQIDAEMDVVQRDVQRLSSENRSLSDALSDVQSIPSVTEYAHVIHQVKSLEHEIEIWTRRVKIAENIHSQLKSQCPSQS